MPDLPQSVARLGSVTDQHDQLFAEDSEPMYEPSEDRPLSGPLMVRNMPAHDEIFFQKLNNKLEEVRKDDNTALPSVLQDAPLDDKTEGPAEQPKTDEPEAAGSDHGAEGSKSTPKSTDEEDIAEIPLKFKKRLSFGAPFGEMR